jgi:hypothetical protein
MNALKNVEWLHPCIGQYRSTTNDIGVAIGEIC